jgi:hypothetical protein
MRNFESSFWKLPQINCTLQCIFLTVINNYNYKFEKEDEDDSSDDEGEIDCQVQ